MFHAVRPLSVRFLSLIPSHFPSREDLLCVSAAQEVLSGSSHHHRSMTRPGFSSPVVFLFVDLSYFFYFVALSPFQQETSLGFLTPFLPFHETSLGFLTPSRGGSGLSEKTKKGSLTPLGAGP